MFVLYRWTYLHRFQAVADIIEPNSSVLDLCCGPGTLYSRYLRQKSVSYIGLDINQRFIKAVVSAGGRGEVRDLRKPLPLPHVDYVVMQGSFYHFLPDPLPILQRMYAAAARAVIISEPIKNLANSSMSLVRHLTGMITNPGTGPQPWRFYGTELDQLVCAVGGCSTSSKLICRGREKLIVINTSCDSEPSSSNSVAPWRTGRSSRV